MATSADGGSQCRWWQHCHFAQRGRRMHIIRSILGKFLAVMFYGQTPSKRAGRVCKLKDGRASLQTRCDQRQAGRGAHGSERHRVQVLTEDECGCAKRECTQLWLTHPRFVPPPTSRFLWGWGGGAQPHDIVQNTLRCVHGMVCRGRRALAQREHDVHNARAGHALKFGPRCVQSSRFV